MLTAGLNESRDGVATEAFFASIRRREFARLDELGLAYLDYTGSALPAERQRRAHDELLASGVFGNPHADSEPSRRSTDALELARALVLRHLSADPVEYTVCFTQNATGAVKLVAESYPFSANGVYVLSADNHNSLNGVREYARRAGAGVVYLPLDDALRVTGAEDALTSLRRLRGPSLFGFPAQSNFSGVRPPLELIQIAHQANCDVLLDAAAFLPSSSLSLRVHKPEFVVLSFYKLFGVPTGLGALVARRDALARLRRPWFAGGTVEYVSVQNDRHSLLPGTLAFEDGTPHFLGAAALPSGFGLLDEVGMERLSGHVSRLTTLLLDGLSAIRHRNGTPAVRLYGPSDMTGRGGTVAFNLLRDDERVIPYREVDDRARVRGVALRGGCFCNPGASERAFGFDRTAAGRCLDAMGANGQFTVARFAECLSPDGTIAAGAVRASLGMANNAADVRRALDLVESFLD